MSPTAQPVCCECSGNCDPECGRHPKGCLYGGTTCNVWDIAPTCRLPHFNVARAKAQEFLDSLYVGIKVRR